MLAFLIFTKYWLPLLIVASFFIVGGWAWGFALTGFFYLALIAALWAVQSKLVYVNPRKMRQTPSDRGFAFSEVFLTPEGARAGECVHGWLIPAARAGAPVVLYCHGIAHNISQRLDVAALWHAAGCGVFMFDYRGFGRSGGRPGEENTYADARAAWAHLTRTLGIRPGGIIIHGHSLGSGVAARLAAEVGTEAASAPRLVLEAAFTGLPEVAQKVLPYIPASWLCRPQYPNLENLRKSRCRALFIHSGTDELVPCAMGEKLFAEYPGEKEFFMTRGSHDRSLTEDAARALPRLREFAERG